MKTMHKSQLFLRAATLRKVARCFTASSANAVGGTLSRNKSVPRVYNHNPDLKPRYSLTSRFVFEHPDIKDTFETNMVKIEDHGNPDSISTVWLRDACSCSHCVDPSTTQKNFQSTDIPPDIKTSSVENLENGSVRVTWENDVPGFEDHVSIYSKDFFEVNRSKHSQKTIDRVDYPVYHPWDKSEITAHLKYATYEQWMTDDDCFGRAILDLQNSGIIIVRGVPETETAVEDLAQRMGPIRDSFYGRTWDVKSVPDAKNVAYTQIHLGLHMDLLYMADPPGFQFLHCIHNSCEGGESIFVDAFQAAHELDETDWTKLNKFKLAYHYRNAGEHYYHEHRVLETQIPPMEWQEGKSREEQVHKEPVIRAINYSPPFQAPAVMSSIGSEQYAERLVSLRAFAKRVEAPENLFEYKLQPGECVVFNNRRILHGRKQFEAAGGQRWLKGAYVDADAYQSRLRTTIESGVPAVKGITQPVFPKAFEAMGGQILKQ